MRISILPPIGDISGDHWKREQKMNRKYQQVFVENNIVTTIMKVSDSLWANLEEKI